MFNVTFTPPNGTLGRIIKDLSLADRLVDDALVEGATVGAVALREEVGIRTPQLTGVLEASETYSVIPQSSSSVLVTLETSVIYGGVVETGKSKSGRIMRHDGGAHMFESGLKAAEKEIVRSFENAANR